MAPTFGPLPMTFLGADDPVVRHAVALHDQWTREHGWWEVRGKTMLRLDARGAAPTVLVEDGLCTIYWNVVSAYRIRMEGARRKKRVTTYTHAGGFPETVLAAMPGQPLSRIIEMPGFESRTVLSTEVDALGQTVFTIDQEAVHGDA